MLPGPHQVLCFPHDSIELARLDAGKTMLHATSDSVAVVSWASPSHVCQQRGEPSLPRRLCS